MNKILRYSMLFAIFSTLILMSGCLENLTELFCDLGIADPGHCYQSAAIGGSDPYGCEKVIAPPEYAKMGSNPPKDKCYLIIAQNEGDYDICKNIKGGYASYTKEECISDIAITKEDPSGCKKLTGAAFNQCKAELGKVFTADKLNNMDNQLDDLKELVAKDSSNPDLKKQLADLEKKKKEMTEFMTDGAKQTYFKTKREDIMSDVEDDDVKSEIAKDLSKFRQQNPTADMDTIIQRLKDIKEEKEFVKRVDEQANQLVDDLKGKISDYADEKKQQVIDAASEKAWEYANEKAGENLKWSMRGLESMKEKYDKASEKYKEINEKIEKIKKVYTEINEVRNKVKDINKLLAEGKIQAGHANVIKGAVYLGKGLEYATQYVPVFGSTVSTITKETFEVTVKLAKKRAQRTTSLDKCFEDPENCDTEGITAY